MPEALAAAYARFACPYALSAAAETLIPFLVNNVSVLTVVAFIAAALTPVVTQTLPTTVKLEFGVFVCMPTQPKNE